MQYQLIENYFETPLFQEVVQDYFDTVLGQIIAQNATVSAKGLFIVDGEQKRDYYDMPYHVHILNGLIPALFVYEKYMQQQNYTDDPEAVVYLKVFILGFTFHDANKLLHTQQDKQRSDLEIAVASLDKHVDEWAVREFFTAFDAHKNNVYYLALSTEDGTWATAEDYPITLNKEEIRGVQRELCHFADGLASIQNEDLESLEALHKKVNYRISKVHNIVPLDVSYVKVRHNPYTLLSQNMLQVARSVLYEHGKKVLYATREGFIFWGKALSQKELTTIADTYLTGSEEDIKFLELTKITAQKCEFGFIGSAPFTVEVLSKVVNKLSDKFLLLSPNSESKIKIFPEFVQLTKKLIELYYLPLEYDDSNGKLALRYYEELDKEQEAFKTVFNLHKIQWLNGKGNKVWGQDITLWQQKEQALLETIDVETSNGIVALTSVSDLLGFIKERVSTSNALFKIYLNFLKTYEVLNDFDTDVEEYIEILQQDIIQHFTPETTEEALPIKQLLFDRYFECPGEANLHFLTHYAPTIPLKKEMCAFTGAVGEVPYKAAIAFAMKARGFSNRTVTSLNNNTSRISALFAEENKLRASMFSITDANLVMYYDFFEAQLEIDKDIILSCIKAKDEVKLLEDGKVMFDKNSSFQYNLYNLEFIKLSPKVEPTFFLVRKCLRMTAQLGIRVCLSGIMTPYQPHKAVFHFENPPRFIKLLGWDSIRLIEVEEILDEIRLVLTFGKDRIESNLLKIALSRQAYFTLYYLLKEKDKSKVYHPLLNFYTKYKHKFKGMTITEKLVELAVKVDLGFKSSAEETWLIRTALDFLRKYHKQDSSREDIIQKTCGEIYRKLRLKGYYDTEDIKAFATAVYDELFLKDWQGKIPTINVEKDWIYQFAFLFREQSLTTLRINKAKKIKEKLDEEGKEINEENVKPLLSKESRAHVAQYVEIIRNLK
ncbi:MAG: hypothetical protein ACFB0B_04155 [Thermonemataceae bacterium]